MKTDIYIEHVFSDKAPRKILTDIYKSHYGELPISGGWGYSHGDAVIIDKNDPIISKDLPFNGVQIEYSFFELRTYCELIVFRDKENSYSGIENNLIVQNLREVDGKSFDVLFFEVSALLNSDWLELKKEWEDNHAFKNSKMKLNEHFEKRNNKMIHYKTECWFDITSFYEKNCESDL